MNVCPREGSSGQRCPYCHKDDLRGKAIIWCESCGAMSHAECVAEHGSCPAPGCGKPVQLSDDPKGECELEPSEQEQVDVLSEQQMADLQDAAKRRLYASRCLFGDKDCEQTHSPDGWHEGPPGCFSAPAPIFTLREPPEAVVDDVIQTVRLRQQRQAWLKKISAMMFLVLAFFLSLLLVTASFADRNSFLLRHVLTPDHSK